MGLPDAAENRVLYGSWVHIEYEGTVSTAIIAATIMGRLMVQILMVQLLMIVRIKILIVLGTVLRMARIPPILGVCCLLRL